MQDWIKKLVNSRLWQILDPFSFMMKDHPKRVLAKRYRRLKLTMKRMALDIMFLTLGVLSAGFGLKGFLLPNKFIDGGAVGISLLIAEVSPFSLSAILILVSIPFIFLGWRTISWEFAVKTGIGIIALALVVAFVPYPEVTQDKLLISVFGGFFLGMGIGLAVRGGGVIDGTEVLAINVSRKTGISIGDIILIMNIFIFSIAAYVLSVEVALYSILTYLVASKTVDFIIEGIEEYTGVTIISPHAEEIQEMIKTVLGRGVTVYKGIRGHGKSGSNSGEIHIIYTVITRLEVSKLNFEIEKIDPGAFVVMTRVKDTKGGMIKHRPLH
jgi:uncharacterized membrane-anchored protein YitT (DUF2179 family)